MIMTLKQKTICEQNKHHLRCRKASSPAVQNHANSAEFLSRAFVKKINSADAQSDAVSAEVGSAIGMLAVTVEQREQLHCFAESHVAASSRFGAAHVGLGRAGAGFDCPTC